MRPIPNSSDAILEKNREFPAGHYLTDTNATNYKQRFYRAVLQ